MPKILQSRYRKIEMWFAPKPQGRNRRGGSFTKVAQLSVSERGIESTRRLKNVDSSKGRSGRGRVLTLDFSFDAYFWQRVKVSKTVG